MVKAMLTVLFSLLHVIFVVVQIFFLVFFFFSVKLKLGNANFTLCILYFHSMTFWQIFMVPFLSRVLSTKYLIPNCQIGNAFSFKLDCTESPVVMIKSMCLFLNDVASPVNVLRIYFFDVKYILLVPCSFLLHFVLATYFFATCICAMYLFNIISV